MSIVVMKNVNIILRYIKILFALRLRRLKKRAHAWPPNYAFLPEGVSVEIQYSSLLEERRFKHPVFVVMLLFLLLKGPGSDMQWCFSQVKGAIDDDVAEGKSLL